MIQFSVKLIFMSNLLICRYKYSDGNQFMISMHLAKCKMYLVRNNNVGIINLLFFFIKFTRKIEILITVIKRISDHVTSKEICV